MSNLTYDIAAALATANLQLEGFRQDLKECEVERDKLQQENERLLKNFKAAMDEVVTLAQSRESVRMAAEKSETEWREVFLSLQAERDTAIAAAEKSETAWCEILLAEWEAALTRCETLERALTQAAQYRDVTNNIHGLPDLEVWLGERDAEKSESDGSETT